MTKDEIRKLAIKAGFDAQHAQFDTRLETFAHLIESAVIKRLAVGAGEPVHHEMVAGECVGYYSAEQVAAAVAAERTRLSELDWHIILREGCLVTRGDAGTLGYRVAETIRSTT